MDQRRYRVSGWRIDREARSGEDEADESFKQPIFLRFRTWLDLWRSADKSALRYRVPVRFAVVGVDQIGTGTIANISSTGIAFRTASAIPVDCFIRVYISLAYSSCGTLMAYGRVVRDGEIVAVSVLRYRFERRVPEISRYIRYKAQSVAARSRKPVRSLRHFRRCREPLARSSCAPRP